LREDKEDNGMKRMTNIEQGITNNEVRRA